MMSAWLLHCLLQLLPFATGILCSIRIDDDLQTVAKSQYYDGSKMTLPISTEAGLSLYQHWLDQALSGLMAAVATQRLDYLTKRQKKTLVACSKKARNPHTHAKCIAPIIGAPSSLQSTTRVAEAVKKFRVLKNFQSVGAYTGSFLQSKSRRTKVFKKAKKHVDNNPVKSSWLGGFRLRTKRATVQQQEYELLSNLSPFGLVARRLTNLVRAFKDKKDEADWQQTLNEVQAEATTRKERKRAQGLLRKRYESLVAGGKSIDDVADRRPLFSPGEAMEEEDLKDLPRQLAKKQLTAEQRLLKKPMQLFREGVKLAIMASGKSVDGFGNKNVRLFSPRFMAITKEEDNNTISLISPSVFSLHDEGEGLEKLASLPAALNTLPDGDQRAWMDFMVEASGVTDAIARMREELKAEDEEERRRALRGPYGQPLYFTKENATRLYGKEAARKIEIHEMLDKLYTKQQVTDLQSTGYALLTPDQIDHVYGPSSPYNDSHLVVHFKNLTRQKVDADIHEQIRHLARDASAFKLRQKDIVLSPVVLTAFINAPAAVSQPTILSPILLSPLIQSPAVFGAIILSPWVFVPVILSPRVLSPLVLSPVLFSPLILSPQALKPIILSPGVGIPAILSPLVLTPFILSPLVMTPLILSPFCLSPFILNPTALTPLVLSPFVLSPSIMSPAFFTAVWLSPYALSPSVESNGAAVSVFLSPSWLS